MGLHSLGRLLTILPERVVPIILFVVRRMAALSGISHALVCTWVRLCAKGQTPGDLLMSEQGCTPSFEKKLYISADSVRQKRGYGIEHMFEACSHALCGLSGFCSQGRWKRRRESHCKIWIRTSATSQLFTAKRDRFLRPVVVKSLNVVALSCTRPQRLEIPKKSFEFLKLASCLLTLCMRGV